MKPLICLAMMASAALADVVSITSGHTLIPSATSPLTVQIDADHEYFAWWLEGADEKQENGKRCTFEAKPGVRWLRVVGMDWVDGVLKPVIKKESRILIVEGKQAAAIDVWDAIEEGQAVEAPPAKPAGPPKRLEGVTIEIKTNPDIVCAPCLRWKREEWPRYVAEGAEVLEVAIPGSSPVPQFRVRKGDQATTWDNNYLTPTVFSKHLEVLR